MNRWWIPLLSAIVILGGIVWSFSYMRDMHPLGSLAARLDQGNMQDISMRLMGVHLIGKSRGKMLWRFKAETIEVSHDRQKAIFKKNIRGSLINNGKQMASLKTEEVIYGVYTHNVMAPGNTQINIHGGPSLSVKNLYWNGYKSKLVCSGGIDANLGGSVLHGERMSVDINKKEILINKVHGAFRLDGNNPILNQELR
ncbi:MAG: hypothetical protein ACYC0V_02565 [Armatimonadota bacterium]